MHWSELQNCFVYVSILLAVSLTVLAVAVIVQHVEAYVSLWAVLVRSR